MMRWATFALLGTFSFPVSASIPAPPALVAPATALAQLHDCNVLAAPTGDAKNATSVHELMPSDIEVVMAMGDGFVAGLGINGTLDEIRGLSFAIGAEDSELTLPNMLSQISRETVPITGSSKGSHVMESVGRANYRQKIDGLNAAQSHAFSKDLLDQVDYLVETLSLLSNSAKNYLESSWKILTLHVGSSDACNSCLSESAAETTPDAFQNNLEQALAKLKKSIPKVLVNVVPLPGFQRIRDFEIEDPYCGTVKEFLGTCPCLHNSTIDTRRIEYNQRLEKIAARFSSKDDSQFVVVYQPLTKDFEIPSIDFVSKFDCFHYSALGHQVLASGLWNSMLTEVGSKAFSPELRSKLKCPVKPVKFFTPYSSSSL